MRHYKIAVAVIEQDSNYLMQRRGEHPKVGAAGLVGFFGGKIEENEDATTALCREVAEETTLKPAEEDLTWIGRVSIEMDHVGGKARVDAEAFNLNPHSGIEVKAQEWELVRIPADKVKKHFKELTPATRAVFEEILWA